jgi:hypothetical protein
MQIVEYERFVCRSSTSSSQIRRLQIVKIQQSVRSQFDTTLACLGLAKCYSEGGFCKTPFCEKFALFTQLQIVEKKPALPGMVYFSKIEFAWKSSNFSSKSEFCKSLEGIGTTIDKQKGDDFLKKYTDMMKRHAPVKNV